MKSVRIFSLIILCCLVSCQPENTPPMALVKAVPEIGDTTTVFWLDATGSNDEESSVYVLRYRWDCDEDGIWDAEYSTRTSFASRFNHTGYCRYRLEVTDEEGASSIVLDSVLILEFKEPPDTLTDARDGNRYAVIRIGETWWMADNLRYGVPIDQATNPSNNDRVECLYFNNSEELKDYGSLYTWEEVHQYPSNWITGDICPPGWRVPSAAEWRQVYKNYSQPFDVLYYLGSSSIENLGIRLTGYYQYGNPDHPMDGESVQDQSAVRYWTSNFSEQDSVRTYSAVQFTRDSVTTVTSYNNPEWILHPFFNFIIGYKKKEACYVRCVRE